MINFQRRKTVDWDDLKQSLEQASASLAAVGELSEQEAKAVMDERASVLAQVPSDVNDQQALKQYITFRLAGEQLALETRFVREVKLLNRISSAPVAADFLIGLTNLRGEVLAVFDLRHLFGHERRQIAEETWSFVIGEDHTEFGLVVDEVGELTSLIVEDLCHPPQSLPSTCQDYVDGVTSDGVLVLAGDALLSDESLYVDEVD